MSGQFSRWGRGVRLKNGEGEAPTGRKHGVRFAVPGRIRAMGECGGGSCAAYGRDAGLKAGAPSAPSGWNVLTETRPSAPMATVTAPDRSVR